VQERAQEEKGSLATCDGPDNHGAPHGHALTRRRSQDIAWHCWSYARARSASGASLQPRCLAPRPSWRHPRRSRCDGRLPRWRSCLVSAALHAPRFARTTKNPPTALDRGHRCASHLRAAPPSRGKGGPRQQRPTSAALFFGLARGLKRQAPCRASCGGGRSPGAQAARARRMR